jgi:hypothetical protein
MPLDPQTAASLLAPNPAVQAQPPSTMGALFGVPPQHLQKMAGDVVPLPINPGPNAGSPGSQGLAGMINMGGPGNVNVGNVSPHPVLMSPQFMELLRARLQK